MSLKSSSSVMRRVRFGSARLAALELAARAAAPRRGALASTTAGHLVGLDRPDVDAVDRGHRRDVAGAQALEGAHVERPGRRRRLVQGGEQLVGAAQRARDVRAHVDVVARRPAACRACRRRSRPPSGSRASGASRTPPARSPPASTSRAGLAACSAGIAAERRSGYAPCSASIVGAQLVGHRRGRRVGDARGVLVEVGRLVPAGDARAVPEARHACRVDRHQRSMPPRIGSSIASVAIRSAM